MAQLDENTMNDECSIYYFGFTPNQFLEDFTELLFEEVTIAVQQMIKNLNEIVTGDRKDSLVKDLDTIHDLCLKRVAVVSEELKPIITELFTIPRNVTPFFIGNQKVYTDDELTVLDKEVEELKQQYLKETKELAVVEAKLQVLKKLEPIYKATDASLVLLKEFTANINSAKEHKKLATAFTNQQQILYPKLEANVNYRLASSKFKTVDKDVDLK